ncbi:MAG TPA: hypothetical protein VIK89_12000 [Cytophagaceae bacterium]
MKYIIACLFSLGLISGTIAQDNKNGNREPERCGNFVIYDDEDALNDDTYVEGDGRMNIEQSTTARSEESATEQVGEELVEQSSVHELPEEHVCPGNLSSELSKMEGDVTAKLNTDGSDIKIKKEGNGVKYKYKNGDEYKYEATPDGEVKVKFQSKEEEYKYRKDKNGMVEYEYKYSSPQETLIIEKEPDKEAEVKYLYEGKLKDSQFMNSPKFKDFEQGCI